nr:hypothetical protein [Tanacetum cinerariifolium]
QWLLWGDDVDVSGVVVAAVVRVAAVEGMVKGGRWRRLWWGLLMVGRHVGASHIVDRIDRVIRVLFGFAGKIPPEKFFGGGGVVVADGRQPAGGGEN